LRTSKAGKPWASFPVVVGKDDDKQWLRVSVFGETAATLCRTLQPGNRVNIEGTLKASIWQPDNGAARINLEVAPFRCMRLGEIGRNKPKQERRDDGRNGTRSQPERPDDRRHDDFGDAMPF
jgi:single-stranded DNA-binding protein